MNCNLCSANLSVLLDLGSHPIANHLMQRPSKETDFYPMRAAGCYSCGLVQLCDRIDTNLFYTNYATPSSWKNEPHLGKLVKALDRLIDKDRRVLDVGCNDGKFLRNLQDEGWTDVFGLEPTTNTSGVAIQQGFKVINNSLNEKTAIELVSQYGLWDLVSVRQVLEHVSDLADFGKSLNLLLKEDGILVIEVPDSRINLLQQDYALWEEHVNYFTPETLFAFLTMNGFELIDQYESVFSGVCLTVVAKKVRQSSLELKSSGFSSQKVLKSQIQRFEQWAAGFESFKERVHAEVTKGKNHDQLILYGVGSRSSNFVNILGISEMIDFAVDSQLEKQGLYMPGSCKEIISADAYRERLDNSPFFILGVNTENEDRVMSRENYFNGAKVYSVLPPSTRLLSAWN